MPKKVGEDPIKQEDQAGTSAAEDSRDAGEREGNPGEGRAEAAGDEGEVAGEQRAEGAGEVAGEEKAEGAGEVAGERRGGETGGETGGSEMNQNGKERGKEEEEEVDGHSHNFTVTFGSDVRSYTVNCYEPRTVLDVIGSHLKEEFSHFKTKPKHEDDNIIIQLSREDRKYIVPTHFPCTCVAEGESLTVLGRSEKVEKDQGQHDEEILPEDRYVLFYIDTIGGKNTKTKKFFRSNVVQDFKFLCVYGEKRMTVEEAVQRDGRFDKLVDFHLSHNTDPHRITKCTERIDSLHLKEFKMCLPTVEKQKPAQDNIDSLVQDLVQRTGISVNRADVNNDLPEQVLLLRQWMEQKFDDNSYQNKVNQNQREQNSRRIQRSFNEVHRVKMLVEMGESVCKIVVEDICVGTGFVLFGTYVLTSAHLLHGCVEGQDQKSVKEGVEVFLLFNYEQPEQWASCFYVSAEKTLVDFDLRLDYAVLELKPDGQRAIQLAKKRKVRLPPGLLKKIGPLPENGEACLISHQGGHVKKIDPTWIIKADNREQAGNGQSAQDTLFVIQAVIRDQGIQNIMRGGSMEDGRVTPNTYMYHGASGSPVFDADCKVVGLHIAGFCYGFREQEEHVIEFAQPLLTIMKKFASNMKRNNKPVFKKLKKAAKVHKFLNIS